MNKMNKYADEKADNRKGNYSPTVLGEKTLKILEELKSGRKQSDIAREFKVSRQYIFKVKTKFLNR